MNLMTVKGLQVSNCLQVSKFLRNFLVPYGRLALPNHSSEKVAHIILDWILHTSLVRQIGQHDEHLYTGSPLSNIFFRKTKKDNLSRVYLEVSDTLPLVHLRRVVFSRSRAGFCIFFRSSSFPEQPAACGCDCHSEGGSSSKLFLEKQFAC